jgi:hypothetical protein
MAADRGCQFWPDVRQQTELRRRVTEIAPLLAGAKTCPEPGVCVSPEQPMPMASLLRLNVDRS